jgi:hypothetical protein
MICRTLSNVKVVSMNVIFTVCNRETLRGALVLAETVRLHEPNSIFCLCWVDTFPLPMLSNEIRLIDVKDVSIPRFAEMCDRYFDFELVAACRPWFAKFLFESDSWQFDTLTFLTPATILFSEIDPLPIGFDLSLTPNISKPLPKDTRLDDKRILNVGMFNAGAWSLRKSEAVGALLCWWADRTVDRAKFDLCNGMCMDQLWLNYAPVRVPKTTIRNCAGWQYGLRSVLASDLTHENDHYLINGEKLISVDFSGLISFDPVWSDHIALLSVNKVFENLFEKYRKRVHAFEVGTEKIGNERYGMVPTISKYRLLRKKVITFLHTAVDFIERV